MNIFLTLVLIGISLSMDAFSLSLIYGTYSLSKKEYIDEQEKILFTNKGLYNYKKT